MDAGELKQRFGGEYPAAVTIDGDRQPLSKETPFSRSYDSADGKRVTIISRFMDGSASITLARLQREWPTWTADERSDFCQNCNWLHEQTDFPDMLRFVVEHGKHDELSAIALSIASNLQQNEAFNILHGALRKAKAGKTSNLTQAIAKTKHHDAETTLRKHFLEIWAHKSLWDDDEFFNWMALDATTCIAHLIELGVEPADFDEQVRELAQHVCAYNRDSCRNSLSKYYTWLR